MAETFPVPIRGIGKPDYSKEIALGRQRPGLSLKYNETLKIFLVAFSMHASTFSWILPPLAPGATASLIDGETGEVMPYTVLQGYIFTILSMSRSFSEDTMTCLLFDGEMYACYGVLAAGSMAYDAQVVDHSTADFDSIGATSHSVDFHIENWGTEDMMGSWTMRGILRAVGTKPLPTTKTVKCKHCGHEHVVPLDTSQVICPKCGRLTAYYNLSRFRGTP